MSGKKPLRRWEWPKIDSKEYKERGKMYLLDRDFSKCMDALPQVIYDVYNNFTSIYDELVERIPETEIFGYHINWIREIRAYYNVLIRQVKYLAGYVRLALKWCINERGFTNKSLLAILLDIEVFFIKYLKLLIAHQSGISYYLHKCMSPHFDTLASSIVHAESFFWESLEPSLSLFSEESVMERLHQAIKDENMYKKHRTECVFLGKLVQFLKEQTDHATWGYVYPRVECALDMMSMYVFHSEFSHIYSNQDDTSLIDEFIHVIVLHILVQNPGSVPTFTDDLLLAYVECVEKSLISLPNKSNHQVGIVQDFLSLVHTFVSDTHKYQTDWEILSNTKMHMDTALRKLGYIFLSVFERDGGIFEISDWLIGTFKAFILPLDTSALSDETLLKYAYFLRPYRFQLLKVENVDVKSPLGDQCQFDKDLVFVAHIVFNNWSEYYIEQETLFNGRVEMVGVLRESVSIISASLSYNTERNISILMNPGLPHLILKLEQLTILFSRTIFLRMCKSLNAENPETDFLGFLDLFLGNLKELRLSNFDWNDQLQIIQEDLVVLRSFLQNIKDNSTRDDQLHDLSIRIRNAVYNAEYIINTFAAGAFPISCRLLVISDLIKELNILKEEANFKEALIKKSSEVLPQELVPATSMSSRASVPPIDVFVGLEAERMRLMNFLASNEIQLDVISIVGMGGIGKTTLAKKVYEELIMVDRFDLRVWCCVSQEYDMKNLLVSILDSDVTCQGKSCADLSMMVHKKLKGYRYLIVLDDVWNINVFYELKRYFPNDSNGSRIVLTSRTISIGLHAKHHSETIDLHPLSNDESWNILKQKVFPREECPAELFEIGNDIARKCGGLPLAVVVVVGILSGSEKKQDAWDEISKRLNINNVDDTRGGRGMKALDLSYELLPDHLKPLFLYVGAFPEDYQIPTKTLIRIWIAEGFIRQETEKNKSLEDQAEKHLLDLIDRSLLMVCKRNSRGLAKTCHIHDILREMSRRKAEDENFMHHHKFEDIEHLEEQHLIYPRRVNVISLKVKTIPTSSNAYGVPPHPPIAYEDLDSLSMSSHLNSLLVFNYPSFNGNINQFYKSTFQYHKMLRVIHTDIYARDVSLGETLPVHLRYISVDNVGAITLFFSMWNLETLIVRTWLGRVKVPKEFWKMVKLRHLHIFWVVISEPDEESFKLENLQTLSTLNFIGEETKIIGRFPNLQRLKCCFSDDDGKIKFYEWPRFESFHQLESLTVDWYHRRLSSQLVFPSNLKKLSLLHFDLNWKDISSFQKLRHLEVLKLERIFCNDELWDMEDVQFPKLKFLKFNNLGIKRWIASDENFPRLQNLVLNDCRYLEEIPSELGYIASLEKIEVNRCSHSASESAKKIQQDQLDNGNTDLKVYVTNPLKEDDDEYSEEEETDEQENQESEEEETDEEENQESEEDD